MTTSAVSSRLARLVLAVGLAACGKSAEKLPGCTTRAECAPAEVCLSGFCQADLVGPTALGHVPATDGNNVWWDDPITIEFDEPIDPASVTDSSVTVTGPTGGSLTRTASVVGNTLSLRLPQPPNDLAAVRITVSLSGQLRDRAGNAIQGAPVTWGFELPPWQAPAADYNQGIGAGMTLAHAVAPDGSVYLSWQDTYAGVAAPEVRRAAGGAWVNLGRPPARVGSAHGIGSSLAIDGAGHPVLAYLERASLGPPSQVIVARHDGTAWVPLGGALNADPARDAQGVQLHLDSDGRPVVVWAETVGTVKHLFVRRWNGADWEVLGGEIPSDPAQGAVAWALAPGPAGALSLALADGAGVELWRFNGSTWSRPGTGLSSTTAGIDMVFDGSGLEVVSFADGGGAQVARWQPGSSGVTPRLVSLGAALTASGGVPSLAWRRSGRPGQQLVAGTGGSLYGWSGAAWGTVASMPVGTLSVNSDGVLACVGQTAVGFEQKRVSAARFNR